MPLGEVKQFRYSMRIERICVIRGGCVHMDLILVYSDHQPLLNISGELENACSVLVPCTFLYEYGCQSGRFFFSLWQFVSDAGASELRTDFLKRGGS